MLIYRAHKNLPHSQNMHQLTVTVYGVVHQHPSIHLPLSQSRSRAIIQLVQDGIPPSFRFSRHLARHEVGVQLRLGDEEVELALLATCLWDEWKEEVSFIPRVHWFFSFWGFCCYILFSPPVHFWIGHIQLDLANIYITLLEMWIIIPIPQLIYLKTTNKTKQT